MNSFSANLDGETVTIVGIDVDFPSVLITYINSSGKLTTKSKRIQERSITLGVAL